MILYIIYNSDILNIPLIQEKEDAIGYVDDIALIAISKDFNNNTNWLESLMVRENSTLTWSKSHNSKFEVNKSAIMHLTHKTIQNPEGNSRIPIPRPELVIEGQIVRETTSYKYLGSQIDNQLKWKEQAFRAIANTTKWISQFRRLTKPQQE